MSSPGSPPSSSPAPTGQPASPNASPISVIGVVLGIVGVLLAAGIIFFTIRMKRRRLSKDPEDRGSESFVSSGTRLDRSHPAARITPFGHPGGETPRFNHTPGADMRIATRRADGAWDFADPRGPFTPTGVGELDVCPSPSSSTGMLPPRVRKKDQEPKSPNSPRNLGARYDRQYDVDINPPPPAYYGQDYGGYLPHAKS